MSSSNLVSEVNLQVEPTTPPTGISAFTGLSVVQGMSAQREMNLKSHAKLVVVTLKESGLKALNFADIWMLGQLLEKETKQDNALDENTVTEVLLFGISVATELLKDGHGGTKMLPLTVRIVNYATIALRCPPKKKNKKKRRLLPSLITKLLDLLAVMFKVKHASRRPLVVETLWLATAIMGACQLTDTWKTNLVQFAEEVIGLNQGGQSNTAQLKDELTALSRCVFGLMDQRLSEVATRKLTNTMNKVLEMSNKTPSLWTLAGWAARVLVQVCLFNVRFEEVVCE